MDRDFEIEYQLLQYLNQFIEMKVIGMSQNATPMTLPDIKVFSSNPTTHTNKCKNMGWLLNEHSLRKLYELMISYGFIACLYEEFKIHFIGVEHCSDKIVWLGPVNKLVYLISRLMESDLIPLEDHIHVLIADHFQNKNHSKLSTGSLRASLCQIRIHKVVTIDKIINTILELEARKNH